MLAGMQEAADLDFTGKELVEYDQVTGVWILYVFPMAYNH